MPVKTQNRFSKRIQPFDREFTILFTDIICYKELIMSYLFILCQYNNT